MKKFLLSAISTLIICALLYSCDFIKKTPKCSDEVVKNLVVKLVKQKIKKQLTNLPKGNIFDIDNSLLQYEAALTKPFNVMDLYNEIYKRVNEETNAKFTSYSSEREKYKEYLTDSLTTIAVNNINISIKSIRIVNIDDKIKKCDCQTDIYNEDNKIRAIEYSAQLTEDKEVYVTVTF